MSSEIILVLLIIGVWGYWVIDSIIWDFRRQKKTAEFVQEFFELMIKGKNE